MTGKNVIRDGIPLLIPNDITNESKDFYISYNDMDTLIYGDVTTALVINNQIRFSILNGDHTKQYNNIIASGGGYAECFQYFKDNIKDISKFSDKPDEQIIVNEDGSLEVIKINNK